MLIDKFRLNLIEGTISPEKQKDSEIIVQVLEKLSNRSNARLTSEEESILRKYDLKKSDNHGLLAVDSRGRYTISLSLKNSGFKSKIRNKSFDLIDYIEKQRDRIVQKGYFSDGSEKPVYPYVSDGKLMRDDPSGKQMIDTYKAHVEVVRRKNSAIEQLSKVDAEYEKACARASEEYEKALQRAFENRSSTTRYYQNQLDKAQEIIDTRLKKK